MPFASTPSFPSGHATGAIAVYGFIAYVLAREAVTVKRRFEIVYWSAVLIGLIGFSRMLLSLHYASDVAAGFLVGAFWLLVGFAIAELIRLRHSAPGSKAGLSGQGLQWPNHLGLARVESSRCTSAFSGCSRGSVMGRGRRSMCWWAYWRC